MAKIKKNVKKIKRLNFQNQVFLLAKSRYYIISTFKMIKVEFKFEYTQ